MNLPEKIKEKVIDHAAEAAIASVAVLLIWVANQLSPVVLPLIESTIPKQVLVGLFVASLLINGLLAWLIYTATKKPSFRLRYGIYWDSEKNPHCPSCKTPVAAYNKYQSGTGYYCKPCSKVFPLADASGKDIDPAKAISEL